MKTVYQIATEFSEELKKNTLPQYPTIANFILTKRVCQFAENMQESWANNETFSTLIKYTNNEEFYNAMI